MILKLTLFDIFHEELVNPVNVNFDNVTYFCRNYATGKGTDIFFSDGSKIIAKQEIEEINRMLGL